MNKEINPIVIIAAVVVLVVILGYFGFHAMSPPTPAPGSYTPGVPPWLDKKSPDYGKGPQSVIHPPVSSSAR